MKSAIAGGINLPSPGRWYLNDLGHYNYQNLNYALCRILLAVINGNVNKGAYFNPRPPGDDGFQLRYNDAMWDLVTIGAYEGYLQAKVFKPSGVVDATLDHPPACALAYRGPDDTKPGWNPGNLAENCCYAGWHISVKKLLDVMGILRRGNAILSIADAQAMLDNGFGVDPLSGNLALPAALTTPAGNVYCKPGDWHDTNNRDEQSLAYFLPEDMELVVFVNSMVDGQTGATNNFRQVVTQAYLDNLTTQLPINR
jgi:hypothetical protein